MSRSQFVQFFVHVRVLELLHCVFRVGLAAMFSRITAWRTVKQYPTFIVIVDG